jgi:hypothetical protein
VDAQLDVLGGGVVELGVVVLVLGDLEEHLDTFLHQVLTNHLEDLVLLQSLSGDVEREVIESPDRLGVYQVGCIVNDIPRTPVRASGSVNDVLH